MYIEKIDSPRDIKELSIDELETLAGEIRKCLLEKLSTHGGHVGPNLGDVELTLALHYVFDSPRDKFVFDVSHQTYTHKILTGRKEAFLNPENYDDVTGFSSPDESEHDFFTIGHTSTSISLACGLAKARNQLGGKENIVAVIGDGSLSGGEAYEGLDYVAEMGTNFIAVVNDNEMSIAENHGGLYRNLQNLRKSNGEAKDNFFKALGWDYMYVNDGNDVGKLIDAFKKVKDIDHPIVIHVHTEKGHGYKPATDAKERFHWSSPFEMETGNLKFPHTGESYGKITLDILEERAKKDKRLVILNSAVPGMIGANAQKRKELGDQFVDVDIAEEHATAMASGIAKGGCIAIYPTSSSFMQRTYDQLSQDVCINDNPVTLVVMGGSVYDGGDKTHLALYDIQLLSSLPNMIYMAPYTKEEYVAMLNYAMDHKEHPLAIRAMEDVISDGVRDDTDYSILNKSKVYRQGSKVAIIAVSNTMTIALEVHERLKKQGYEITVINPVFLSGLDEQLLTEISRTHDHVITLEDGQADGGFGQKVAAFMSPLGTRVHVHGVRKEFFDCDDVKAELKKNGLDADSIEGEVLSYLK